MSNSRIPKGKSNETKHKKYGKFTIQRMTNPSGTVYWRVAGIINGKRYRKRYLELIPSAKKNEQMAEPQLVCSQAA